MENNILKKEENNVEKVTIIRKLTKCFNSFGDMSKEIEQMSKINPKDTYEKKISIIEQSDMSAEEKIKLLDETQDKYIEDNQKSLNIYEELRSRKIVSFGKFIFIATVTFGLTHLADRVGQNASEELLGLEDSNVMEVG